MDQETKTEGMGNTMASICKGMAEKPGSVFLLVLPGLLLVQGDV
jgi:hypothetical protein